MSISIGSGGKFARLFARIKALVIAPDAEWAVIDTEPATTQSLYRDYVFVLAAITPAAIFLHGLFFGYGPDVVIRPSFFAALFSALLRYGLTLAGVLVAAFVIDTLAPYFQAQKNLMQALKLVVFASTASWVAGIFYLIPGLGFLSVLGLYSLILFYKGLPLMMKANAEKAVPYTAVSIVAVVATALVISSLARMLLGGQA